MESLGSRNLLVTLSRAFGFILLLCLSVELSQSFIKELHILKSFRFITLYSAFITPFLLNEFVSDTNPLYNKTQSFFFRSSFFSVIIPAAMLIVALGYLILPKLMGGTFNKEVYVFIGGYIFMTHLISIARQNKSGGFAGFINYAFTFSMLLIVAIVLLGLYLRVAYNFRLGKVILDSVRDSTMILRTMFNQVVR